jgi:hypothetical protein
MSTGLQIKYPLHSSDLRNLKLLERFSGKKIQILNFVKIRPVGAKQVHADERTETQTGMTKPLFEITRNRLKEL